MRFKAGRVSARRFLLPMLALGALVAFVAGAQASPGTLDQNYGNGGKAYIDFGNNAWANTMVVDESNRVVQAGYVANVNNDIAVSRLKLNGTPDNSTFSGDTAKLTIDLGGNDVATGLSIGGDHKYVIAGTTDKNGTNDAFILRRNVPGGSADVTFNATGQGGGIPGQNIVNIGGNDRVSALLRFSDGKWVVGGTTDVQPGGGIGANTNFFIARFTTKGVLDAKFTNASSPFPGVIIVDFGGNDTLTGLFAQNVTKWYAAGYTDLNGNNDIAMAGFKSQNKPDNGFGGQGTSKLVLAMAGSQIPTAVKFVNNKKIAMSGCSAGDMFLARFSPQAHGLDGSFDSGGFETIDFGGAECANAFLFQAHPDRKLLPVGSTNASGNNDFAFARLLVDGGLDPAYGSGGMVTTNFNATSDDVATGIGSNSTNYEVYVGGYSNANGHYEFAASAYLPS